MESTSSRNWSLASTAGAIVSAFLASLCCIGPLVFAVLGIGGAGLLVKFEPYRPYLAAITLLFLGIGFYFTYRQPKLAEGDACGCEYPKSNRLGKMMLWMATILAIGFLSFPYLAAHRSAEATPLQVASARSVTLDIAGMDCAACTTAIRIALKKVNGVKEAKVSFEEKRAMVEYEPAKVTPQQLVDAVNKLGYRASLPPGQPGT